MKVAVFDIDGTIFRNSLLIELHWKMVRRGLIPREAIKKLDKLYWSWVTRKGGYARYLGEVINSFSKFIEKKSVKEIEIIAKKVVKIQSEIVYRYTRNLVEELQKTHTLIAISGSPEPVVKEFIRAWKFNYYLATTYEAKDNIYTGKVLNMPVEDKKKALLELCEEQGLSLEDSIGVGDTESDVGIFELVKEPICFNPTSKLYKIAQENNWLVVVERKDKVYKIKKGKIV